MTNRLLLKNSVQSNRIKLLLTPHHTGTWFWFKVLTAHPDVNSVLYMDIIESGFDNMNSTIAHPLDIPVGVYANDRYNILHSHIEAPITSDYYLLLTYLTDYFISIRDPFKSLITRWNRNREEEYRPLNDNIVNEWIILSELNKKRNLNIVRLDHLDSYYSRVYALIDIYTLMGLDPNLVDINTIAKEWTPLNTQPTHEDTIRYEAGDFDYLNKNHKNDIEYFLKYKEQLKDFCMQHGYNDLPWYHI